MIESLKKFNLYVLPDKSSYHEISKFIKFLSEENNILYLDFSYDKNSELGHWYMNYKPISYETAQSVDKFREFVKPHLFNTDIVLIDINGVHNLHLIKDSLELFDKVNLNVLCLKKRSSHLLFSENVRWSEVYIINNDNKLQIASTEESFTFESFKLQYIREIKLDKLI